MSEIWKDIEGYGGLYKVSNWGRVKSLKKYAKTNERILVKCVDSEGYYRVTLWKRGEGKQDFAKIHKLETNAFLGKCPKGMEVCHYNGNKKDNRLSNLRYDTRAGNKKDDVRLGTYKGTNAGNCKLKECEVKMMRYLHKKGIKQTLIAKMFKIDGGYLNKIVHYKFWTHI